MPATPAARAAVDMALHDLAAQGLGLPLCELLGRAHEQLPTSITIGIKPAEETLREADEYLGRGFRAIKVKVGRALDEDIERLRRLRARVGPDIALRADANQGYTLSETGGSSPPPRALDLELVEQPVKAADTRALSALRRGRARALCADESLLTPADALALAHAPGALRDFQHQADEVRRRLARPADRRAWPSWPASRLMWGCMDESRIGISAALHAAFATPATRYLDLDGSFDLARDVAEGGFVLKNGLCEQPPRPGSACARSEYSARRRPRATRDALRPAWRSHAGRVARCVCHDW